MSDSSAAAAASSSAAPPAKRAKAYEVTLTDGVSDTTDYKGSGRLEGKVAIITGGSKAIGKTICEVFAKEGCSVHFRARNAAEGEATCKGIIDAGGKATFTKVYVANEAELKTWIDGVGKAEGKIDIVVPNAAAFVFGRIEDVDSAAWDKILAVNVKGYANCTKFSLPWIRASGKGGSIVNMASISSHIAQEAFVPYNTTKGAIMQMTRCLALDLGPEGIRVNAVCPGTIDTPATSLHAKNLGITKAELTKDTVKDHFIKRLGSTLDCAYATLFLASDESTFITGTHLLVDGGYCAH